MAMEQESSTAINNLELILMVAGPVVGVVAGGLLAWIPLRRQLKHDSKERKKERQMSLCRDVYLPAMETIGQQLQYLANLYNTNEPQPKGYTEAILQIQVIGSDETIATINKFNDYLATALLELNPLATDIIVLEARSKSIEKFPGGTEEEINENIQKYIKIFEQKNKLTGELAVRCQEKIQVADELLTPVIVAIRKEMVGTPFDKEAFRAMKKISNENWKHEVEKYLVAVKDKEKEFLQKILKDDNPKKDENV